MYLKLAVSAGVAGNHTSIWAAPARFASLMRGTLAMMAAFAGSSEVYASALTSAGIVAASSSVASADASNGSATRGMRSSAFVASATSDVLPFAVSTEMSVGAQGS